MEFLPDEILLVIFSYCKVTDLTLLIRNVCSRWRRLSNDLFLWEDLELHILPWLVNRAEEMLNSCTHLHSLILYANIDEIAGKLTNRLPLHTLRLWSARTPQPYVVHGLTSTFPNLTEFGIMFRDCDIWDYLYAFKNLTSVQRVVVSYSGRERGLVRTILQSCPTLTGLNISGCFWLNDDDLMAIVEERSDTLEVLSLDGVLFTAKSLSQLARCIRLHTLKIGSSDISQEKLSTIKDLPALRCLNLHHAKNIPADFYQVFFTSQSLANLTEMKLFQCRLTDSAAVLLAHTCIKLRTLKLKIISIDCSGSEENLDQCSNGKDYEEGDEKTLRSCIEMEEKRDGTFSNEHFSDEGLKVFLVRLKYLRVFEVVCERITDKYFCLILKNLRCLLKCRIRGKHNHYSWPARMRIS